ncbi:MAG: helix-turn-helix transcriptional regulator [Bifidobacteriaceae bacterium]|nr:helix-turn-helix transcriptional regulator [Bifidobacteriaceae bacterium]
MGSNQEAALYLRHKREQISPEDAGFPMSPRRRTKGLRRAEVAQLAGLSVGYYDQIEQGKLSGVSEQVLKAVGGALRLTDSELVYLYGLTRGESSFATQVMDEKEIPWSYLRLLEGLRPLPAHLSDNRFNILALNPECRELLWPLKHAELPVNQVRFSFLDPRAKQLYRDWESRVAGQVGIIRRLRGEFPCDTQLEDLVTELTNASPVFKQMWGGYPVEPYARHTHLYRHPDLGECDLAAILFISPAPEVVALCVFVPEPGSASEAFCRQLSELAGSSYHSQL